MQRILMMAWIVASLFLSGCFVESTFVFDGEDVFIVEFASVDSEDGFADSSSIILHSGILVEEDLSTGFLSFHIHAIPRHAIISSAFLFIGVHTVFPAADSVFVDMFVEPGSFAGTFEIFVTDENNYILLDVTDVLIDARNGGFDTLEISLEARHGGVFLEDGGDNLNTGLIPFIEVTYL